MATKKTKKSDIPEGIQYLQRPDLPFDDKSLDYGTKPTTPAAPDYTAQFAELSANIKRLEEQNQQLSRTNMALMGTPQQQMPKFGPDTVDLENLPDPVTNPKEYAAEIVRRGDAVLQSRQQKANWQQQQQSDISSKVDAVWSKFAKAYPDYAANSELTEYAASKAVAQAKAQGMDVNKYMFSATPAFFSDVVGIIEGMGLGKKEEEEEEVVRTSGIPGGLESGGAITKGKDPDEVRIPSLMEELRGWKEKTGFYS